MVTGAGISLASGIPTFRGSDPGAVWTRDVTELGTRRFFEHDPVASWQWYLHRFASLDGRLPNPGHEALVELERWQEGRGGGFLLVTQNIDTLHEQAGSRALVKVHGSADRVRCSRDGCAFGAPAGSLPRAGVDLAPFLADPSPATLPRCPRCGAPLRQHVLWFDEHYGGHRDYGWERVVDAAHAADLVLFVGTSFAVGATDLVLRAALDRRRPALAVDPRLPSHLPSRLERWAARAEELLPATMERLRGATA